MTRSVFPSTSPDYKRLEHLNASVWRHLRAYVYGDGEHKKEREREKKKRDAMCLFSCVIILTANGGGGRL